VGQLNLTHYSVVLKLPIPHRAWQSAFHWCLGKFGESSNTWAALAVKSGEPYVFVFRHPKDAVTFMLKWNEWYR